MKNSRPLSPHLIIYKAQITSAVSIFHRISGSLLGVGFLMVLLIINFDTIYSEAHIIYYNISSAPFFCLTFNILLNLIVGILCFHFCNGIRHLLWDFCFGLDIKIVTITGLLVLTTTCAILFIVLI
jgi:succinate dehydrogenase / fumarate reductase cytochrome b subunit